MLIAEHARVADIPADWRRTVWPAFEKNVLGLLEEACSLLRQDARRHAGRLERDYSWILLRHLERLCRRRNLPYSPRYDPPLLSDDEFAAGASPHQAPLLDLLIRWHHLQPDLYFGIEAKVLVTKKFRSYKPWDTIDAYVSKGMNRFVVAKYAALMPAAAMVGYVLIGNPPHLVAKINTRLAKLGFPCSEPLILEGQASMARYGSVHPRLGMDVIRLHHLFVCFEHDDLVDRPVTTTAAA